MNHNTSNQLNKNRNLVIVESGAKAKTISKFLNIESLNSKYGTFKVIASNGHIRDLIKYKKGTENGIDVTKWIAHYEPIKDKIKTIKNLKSNIDQSDTVWLAADLDREGESIAWHIKDFFKLKNYKRITFNEITQKAIINAINNSGDINYNITDAQQGRRILDRIIGFKMTQILWKNFDTFSNISAGRVQSVLLRILCENEVKINKFQSMQYWNVQADFKCGTLIINDAKLHDKSILKKYESKPELLNKFKLLSDATFKIDKTNSLIKRKYEKPQLPFITSTLQQEAYNKFGFSSKITMKIAQELYESGHITYMRTDSTKLSQDAMNDIKNYINKTYSEKDFKNNNTLDVKKSKNAQEAHECIRPSQFVENIRAQIPNKDDKNFKKLYKLIFDRTVASQMQFAVYEELCVNVNSYVQNTLSKETFIGKSRALISRGFLKVYLIQKDSSMENILKSIVQSENQVVPTKITGNHVWMTPPLHFNESKVIKTLETYGIGRPSTYASILEKLYKNQFIETKDVCGTDKTFTDFILHFHKKKIEEKTEQKPYFKETNKIIPTENGTIINTFISNNFKNIINVDFTNMMEQDLDHISEGNKQLKNVMQTFYDPFVKECNKLTCMEKEKIEGYSKTFKLKTTEYIVRNAKYGPVIQYDKSFISLQAFLEDSDKNIEDVTQSDVILLVNIPFQIDTNRTLLYGRYGFYIKFISEQKTLRIYKNKIDKIHEKDFSSFILKE
jgi:DNA topoisomerase-1